MTIEAEITGLDTAEEREMFLKDIGLEEPGVNKLIHAAYHLLKLQTYFTAGVQEVRAWTIHQGDTGPKAAGVIHSDFEKGYIRAEVMAYTDFTTLGSEAACRAAGKLRVEGKEYLVKDGDVMHFLFNVLKKPVWRSTPDCHITHGDHAGRTLLAFRQTGNRHGA